jgi:hypothetical protein
LGQSIDAATNFKVDPVVVHMLHEVVFVDEFLGDVGEFNFDILGTI